MAAGMISAPDAFLSQPVIVTASPSVSYFKWGLTDTASVGLVSATGSSGLTSCCFSSTGLTSSLGGVGFSLADSEPSDDDFFPHPPNRRGSDTDKRRTVLMGSVLLILLLRGLPPAHLIFKGWCGFLADKLYRSTPKSLTPTLRFGFAVDGGGCVFENLFTRFRSIPKKCHCGQAVAEPKSAQPNAGNSIRDRNARQASAVSEGPTPDAGNAIRGRDSRQACAAIEGIRLDAGNAIRDRDARQVSASHEGKTPDTGDTIRNSDARQAAAVKEGPFTYAGDAIGN